MRVWSIPREIRRQKEAETGNKMVRWGEMDSAERYERSCKPRMCPKSLPTLREAENLSSSTACRKSVLYSPRRISLRQGGCEELQSTQPGWEACGSSSGSRAWVWAVETPQTGQYSEAASGFQPCSRARSKKVGRTRPSHVCSMSVRNS